MADYQDILKRAIQIRDAVLEGTNTASLVGGVMVDTLYLSNKIESTLDKIIDSLKEIGGSGSSGDGGTIDEKTLAAYLINHGYAKKADIPSSWWGQKADNNNEVKGAMSKVLSLLFDGDTISLDGVAGEETPSDNKTKIVTPYYIGDKYIPRKDDANVLGTLTFEKIQKFMKGLTSEQLAQFNKGATFGSFISSILIGTGAKIDELGNGEFESITSRSAIIAKELIVNRQTAIESNFFTTESGVVDEVTEIPPVSEGGSTTYELKLQKRWDNDLTAFHEQDCVRASINTLMENGKYYDMWFRVLSVNTVTNTITVVMYPDEEVPSKKNYPPCELARLIRWGNPVDEARQRLWYLSAEDGTIILLNHVTKPIIDKSNYSIAIGLLPNALSFVFQDFPNADPNDGAIYTKWIAAENFVRKDYEGNVRQDVIDRGLWSLDVANSDSPYRSIATEVHDVWHYGCRWRCLEDKTILEPMYSSQGWAFVEGNPDFKVEMTSSNGWDFDCDRISERDGNGDLQPFTTLSFNATLYNRDVKDHVSPKNVIWTRDTGNPQEDNAWAVKKADSGFSISLTWEDLGTNANERWKCTFKVQATIIDETASLSGTQRIKVSSDKIDFTNE